MDINIKKIIKIVISLLFFGGCSVNKSTSIVDYNNDFVAIVIDISEESDKYNYIVETKFNSKINNIKFSTSFLIEDSKFDMKKMMLYYSGGGGLYSVNLITEEISMIEETPVSFIEFYNDSLIYIKNIGYIKDDYYKSEICSYGDKCVLYNGVIDHIFFYEQNLFTVSTEHSFEGYLNSYDKDLNLNSKRIIERESFPFIINNKLFIYTTRGDLLDENNKIVKSLNIKSIPSLSYIQEDIQFVRDFNNELNLLYVDGQLENKNMASGPGIIYYNNNDFYTITYDSSVVKFDSNKNKFNDVARIEKTKSKQYKMYFFWDIN